MTDGAKTMRARPLSPHLQVWRFHLTMLTSILHRITGVGLYLGALVVAAWAISLAAGPDAYGQFKALLGSPLGKLVMFGMTVSFFYHLANGVRHLVWDVGYGFTPKTATATGVVVFAFTAAATLAVWLIAAMIGAL
jgi:succinate dehydrogenase / fumarate reductase cytochrome b subunit